MFIQVIQGRTNDAAGMRKHLELWKEEHAPSAAGWLGTTAGVTADGEFIAVARFESPEAAQRNSDRLEQGAWWQEMLRFVEGVPTVRDCEEVDIELEGGSDYAGFVQFYQAAVRDPDELAALEEDTLDLVRELRPDLIGGMRAWDGNFVTAVNYFTSESEARRGERVMSEDEEMAAIMPEWESLLEGARWFDITEPWLFSP